MSDLETLERRLDEHSRQDFEQFQTIRESLENINSKLDNIAEKTIRIETIHDTATISGGAAGAIAGSRWSALIAIVIAGVFQACQWVSGYSPQ